MFLGTYEPRLDEKGRLILPAKYRDELSEGLVIIKGHDYCLYVYPIGMFERLRAHLQESMSPPKERRIYNRLFFPGGFEQILDKQGRVNIPPALRQYAGLSRDVSVIGVGDHIEIWDRQAWEQYLQDNEELFAERDDELIPKAF